MRLIEALSNSVDPLDALGFVRNWLEEQGKDDAARLLTDELWAAKARKPEFRRVRELESDLEAVEERDWDQGYSEGHDDGYEEGFQAGLAAAAPETTTNAN